MTVLFVLVGGMIVLAVLAYVDVSDGISIAIRTGTDDRSKRFCASRSGYFWPPPRHWRSRSSP
jgi:hypothetical protein